VKFRIFRIVGLGACVFLLVGRAAAAASGGRPGLTVRIPIWTHGGDSGKPSGLSLRDLSIQMQGRKVTPEFLLGPDSDLFLLVALDLTGDNATATDAENAEIEKLPRRAYVSALSCQGEVHVLEEPTTNRAYVLKSVRSIEVTGKSGLLNCLERVESIADAMLARSAVRVGVVFVSDATVQNYREDLINPIINASDPNDLSRRFPEQLVRNAMAALARRMEPSLAPLFIGVARVKLTPMLMVRSASG
jgi:hypothetical protein